MKVVKTKDGFMIDVLETETPAVKKRTAKAKPKHITNTQLVNSLMSNPNVMMQAFVIEAIRTYAEHTKDAPDWASQGFISQDSWRECARVALDTINYRSK